MGQEFFPVERSNRAEPARIDWLEACDYAMSDTSWNTGQPTIRFAIWGLCQADGKALSRAQLDTARRNQ